MRIAHISAVIHCDCVSTRAVYRTQKAAAAAGGEIRVVITTAPVRLLLSPLAGFTYSHFG